MLYSKSPCYMLAVSSHAHQVAEELKGLQEQSTPFSDDVALRILVAWSRLEDASEPLL